MLRLNKEIQVKKTTKKKMSSSADKSDDVKVEEKPVEKKSTPKKSASFDVDAKIKTVMESKLPSHQKEALVQKLRPVPTEEGRVVFSVYAKIKGIKKELWVAMQAYPKAKGVGKATVKQWDEIFKDF
jgi:hypothetical protein